MTAHTIWPLPLGLANVATDRGWTGEPVDRLVLLAAAYLHDIVAFEKSDPRRAEASRLAAETSRVILTKLAFPPEKLDAVMHAIEAHSFSAQIRPRTLEARILQDADRIEALGAIGLRASFMSAVESAQSSGNYGVVRFRPVRKHHRHSAATTNGPRFFRNRSTSASAPFCSSDFLVISDIALSGSLKWGDGSCFSRCNASHR